MLRYQSIMMTILILGLQIWTTNLVSHGRRPLRSSTNRTLTVPRTHNRFGDRSFAVAGPRLWNSLPTSLRQISSFGQFSDILKIIYLVFEKSQHNVTYDFLRYINILTYLLTYLQSNICSSVPWHCWLGTSKASCMQKHNIQSWHT